MKKVVTPFVAVAAAFAAVACSAPVEGENTGSTSEGLSPCATDPALCPVPPPAPIGVVGKWSRKTATLLEVLDLRADGSYALTETSRIVCVTLPCPAMPTVVHRTEGAYAVGGAIIKLRPTTPDPALPEAFDIVRRPVPLPTPVPQPIPDPPATTEAADTDTSIPAPFPLIALHAVERGADIYLTREVEECPAGTTKCMQCGAYPPGGVCTTFVCLPPGRRCIPVPGPRPGPDPIDPQ
jgi:hypothetical protein